MKKNESGGVKKDVDIATKIKEEFKRHTNVLMEQMRHEVKTVAEGHADLMRKLEEHDARFDNMDKRFDGVNVRLVGYDKRFVKLESELQTIGKDVMETSDDVKRLEKKLDENLENHEKRITMLEDKVLG